VRRAVGAKDCARDKPAPDPIFKALDGTGIAPDETVWMVGDSLADLRCAHAAGCLPVLVGGPEELPAPLLAHPPRLRARNCNELVALL
jgi:phosphoglycolate phosphatase